jgi:dihydropyrimidinase
MCRPEEVEAEATHRALMIANRANCPLYVVHVMSKGAADEVRRARQRGWRAFGEPIAAGLAVDGSHCWHDDWRHASAYVMGPPLRRDPTTKDYLMKMLATGDLQCTGTDNWYVSECEGVGWGSAHRRRGGVQHGHTMTLCLSPLRSPCLAPPLST